MSDLIVIGATVTQERRIRSALTGDTSLRSWNGGTQGPEAAAAMVVDRPIAVVLGPQLGDDALVLARAIEEADPAVTTLLIAKSSAATLEKAMSAGVRGVIAPDAKRDAIKGVLDRVLATGERLRTTPAAVEEAPRNRFIAVISAKGGAGKTVISSNLASAIAMGSERDTVLVDLDLQFGDAATALLLSPTHSIIDAANAASRKLDAAALKVFLTRHTPTDLFVLCAPEEPAAGENLPLEDIGAVLDVLAEEFRQVVIDTDPGLSESTLTALERATDVVIVADLDVPSVRGTRKLIEALDTIGMRSATRHLVLNRADSKVGLTAEEVEDAVGMTIDVALPSTRQVPISLNEGSPMVLSAPRAPFTKRFHDLARRLVPSLKRSST